MSAAEDAAQSAPAFKDHFSSRAADYASYRPRYPASLVDYLAGLVEEDGTAWDVGCGTGQLSVPLAAAFARVLATDASAQQLANSEPHPRVLYRCAPAEQSGLPDSCADLVVVAQAAHWFDLPAFYAEVRRVAREGAPLALVTYALMYTEPAIDALVARFHDETLAPYWPPERWHVVDGYGRLPFPFREFAAPPLTIEEQWDLSQLLGYVGTWSGLRQAEKTLGTRLFDDFCREAAALWGPPQTRRTISWPIYMRIGFISKDAAGA